VNLEGSALYGVLRNTLRKNFVEFWQRGKHHSRKYSKRHNLSKRTQEGDKDEDENVKDNSGCRLSSNSMLWAT
jgi:hypothetical protein